MKRKSVALLLALLTGAFGFSACNKDTDGNWSYQITKSVSGDTVLVEIRIDEKGEDAFLLDVMNKAKEEGELTFELSGGMLVSMEGYANDADFNPCWMLYTSDEELSNTEWGTVIMGERTLGSAILGAEALPIEEGESYVWSYVHFSE